MARAAGEVPPFPDSDVCVYTYRVGEKRSCKGLLEYEENVQRTAPLLGLLLGDDFAERMTASMILHADAVALFRLLPLVVATIQEIGLAPGLRSRFAALVSALRARAAACRMLKLRFLLLLKNPGYAEYWNVRFVHRRNCYDVARCALRLKLDESETAEEGEKEHVPDLGILRRQESLGLNAVFRREISIDQRIMGWKDDSAKLAKFAMTYLFSPLDGVNRREMRWRMRHVQNAFQGSELVDVIMKHAHFARRREAVEMARALLDQGFIQHVGHHRGFVDGKRVFTSTIEQYTDDDSGSVSVVGPDGEIISSWEERDVKASVAVAKIEVQLALDMIDLQSMDFWTNTVYVKGVDKGYRYGYRAIVHPLLSGGIDQSVFSSKVEDIPFDSASVSTSSIQAVFGEDANASDGTVSATSTVESINLADEEPTIIGNVVVRKVFSSIARPMIIELRTPIEDADLDKDEHYNAMNPNVLVKEGDNLMQDMGTELMFQCFNYIWSNSRYFPDAHKAPFSYAYEVQPTSVTQGFMETVTGLTSLKEYDWDFWRDKYANNDYVINKMVRSAAGSYVGAYVLGARDRHWDNILIKDDKILMHIDFGFLLGTSPPIDGPRFSISRTMENAFKKLFVWDKFVEMSMDAFMALREQAPALIRVATQLFSKAGYERVTIKTFLQGKFSFNLHESDADKARGLIQHQIGTSSWAVGNKIKAFSHEHIDPAWYGLLERGFPPAVAIMKLVDAKEQKAAKTLGEERKAVARNGKLPFLSLTEMDEEEVTNLLDGHVLNK